MDDLEYLTNRVAILEQWVLLLAKHLSGQDAVYLDTMPERLQ